MIRSFYGELGSRLTKVLVVGRLTKRKATWYIGIAYDVEEYI